MSNMHSKHSGLKALVSVTLCALAFFSISAALPPPALPGAGAADPTLADLAVARYQVATKGYDMAMSGHGPNDAPGPEVLDWMRRRVKARLDIVEPKNS